MPLLELIGQTLRDNVELAFFLTLGGGYIIGNIKLGSQRIGAVLGVLMVGLIIGQVGLTIADEVKWILFYLFLFAIGFKSGPQFISGLRTSGVTQLILTVIFAVAAVSGVLLTAWMFGFDVGTSAGLFAGSLTATAALGVITNTLNQLNPDPALVQVLHTHLTSAFAASYFIGVSLTIFFLSRIGPKLIGSDLPADCKTLEESMGTITDGSDHASSYQEFLIRTYRIPASLAGTTIQDLENSFTEARVFVERVRTVDGVEEPDPLYRLCEGDHIALSGRESVLIGSNNPLRDFEVSDREVLQVPVTTSMIQITSKDVHGKYMGDIGKNEAARGVFLLEWKRNGQPLPKTMTTKIMIGDRVTITGTKSAIDRVSAYLGKPIRASITSDVAMIGLTAALSGAIGLISFNFGGIAIGLGTSVAILLGGIVAGWWTSSHQMTPPVPDAVLWFLDSVGLAGFIAVTALTAGPAFITSIRESGLAILTGAVLTTIFPHMVTLLVGRWIFKVHPGILLGISAGAGTCAPSLAAVQEAAHSSVPTLGYSVSYAIGNILLAFAGISIVLILSR